MTTKPVLTCPLISKLLTKISARKLFFYQPFKGLASLTPHQTLTPKNKKTNSIEERREEKLRGIEIAREQGNNVAVSHYGA